MDRILKGAIVILLLAVHPMSQAQNEPPKNASTWTDKSGKVRTLLELEEILQQHKRWLDSEKKVGVQADLRDANLTKVWLRLANLVEANLSGAVLTGADLTSAKLGYANLDEADLSGANLTRANISHANLEFADLTNANLREANLDGASMNYATIRGALFEPASLRDLKGILSWKSLISLTYDKIPTGLIQLRKRFEEDGLRDQERIITYVLKRREAEVYCERCRSQDLVHGSRAILWSSDSTAANCGSFVLNTVFFDWTCQYGMDPGRPMSLGFLLWLICSLLYFVCIHTTGDAGLYRVSGPGIRDDPKVSRRVKRIASRGWGLRKPRSIFHTLWGELLLLRTAMFFSLMSAFNIGFRDINFGRWLRLLTRQEFDIKATGWVRVVAGWQSLISVYLIALWVLTYFGRPFN